MSTLNTIDETEKACLFSNTRKLLSLSGDIISSDEKRIIYEIILEGIQNNIVQRDSFGLHPIVFNMQTAIILSEEIGLNKASVLSILLHESVAKGVRSIEDIESTFGEDVAHIIRGLIKVNELYSKNPSIETENFRDLLLSFAEDMRVIFIIIANRVNLMRQIKDKGTDEDRHKVATEASHLYAPLAHKLGLYLIKSELEDLSLKYLNNEAYYHIKEKLAATKRARDKYIADFIKPVEEKLLSAGLKFHIKGRTKSIHSIWQKMQKQKCKFEGIYDLFAIRIILDSRYEKEKQDCWQAFSIVTDMYRPNPKRLRDWLSVPKSNGYESLHITVMGPEGKWVEIQIRTERMDEIAERGLAAHWRYKGVKDSGGKLEEWLKDIRTALETGGASDEQIVDQFKVDLYSDEVFVFTPKGDLFKLPKGATVLDFAFLIHTNVGCHCQGGLVNGKNVHIHTKLKSGDQVEILTSPKQQPKQDWLNFAVTSKAKTKIRQSISEQEMKATSFAKEMIERKFKNRKIELNEAHMARLIKKMGYKHTNEFYKAIASEILDVNTVIERYVEALSKENSTEESGPTRSAENYVSVASDDGAHGNKDVLIIDNNIKGIEFNLAKCCNPIYGDKVFGFVTVNRGITIHRCDCPNAKRMRESMGYRVIQARWAGKGSEQYAVTLKVVGHDDIGIINNITSVLGKEKNVLLRGISIKSSEDGLFSGTLTVMISEQKQLSGLIKKIESVKGVKQVFR